MNKRVQWRGVMLVTMAVVSFGLAVRSYAATTPAAIAAVPTIERYNPYLSGDRMVFTQVTRQPDDSTTAAIWSRDLTTGRESLVAAIGTGEAMPVTSGTWTAWSEMASDTHVSVKARSNRGGPVLDVFTTQASPFGGGNAEPDTLLSSVSLVDNRLVTTNGTLVPLTAPELVRFDLPRTEPTYVDVITTQEGLAKTWVSAGRDATVMSDIGPPQLFFVLDNGGKLVSSPLENCTAGFNVDDSQAVIDGKRVAIGLVCNGSPAVATCILPCPKVDIVSLPPFSTSGAPRIALNGNTAVYIQRSLFPSVTASSVMMMDLAAGTPPVAIRTTANGVGPRVTISAERIAWDETSYADGALAANLYVYDRRTGATSVIDGAGGSHPTPAAAPVRLDPDVRNGDIAYHEINADGTESGIWVRSLAGRPSLVSVEATSGSLPHLGNQYVTWNRPLPSDPPFEQVVGRRRDGRGPVLDVFATDVAAPPTALLRPISVDMDGDRAIVSTFTTDFSVQPTGVVSTVEVGRGNAVRLTPPSDPFASTNEQNGRGSKNTTIAIADPNFAGPARTVAVYDQQGTRSTVSPGVPGCSLAVGDVDGPTLVTLSFCFNDVLLSNCTLPCAAGSAVSIPVAAPAPLDRSSDPLAVALAVSNGRAVVQLFGFVPGGRYRRSRSVPVTTLQLFEVGSTAPPRTISADSGTVSAPRVDGDTVVWSVDRLEGVRTGTIKVYDIRRSVLTQF